MCDLPLRAGSSPTNGGPEYADASVGGGGGSHMMSHEAVTDSRYRFLTWIDNTFHDLDAGGATPFSKGRGAGDDGSTGGAAASGGGAGGGGGGGQKKSYRKALWDEKGDWLEAEPDSYKALNKLLARPLSHLWQVRGGAGAQQMTQGQTAPVPGPCRRVCARCPSSTGIARRPVSSP
jgi:hypothetical protein